MIILYHITIPWGKNTDDAAAADDDDDDDDDLIICKIPRLRPTSSHWILHT